MKATSLILLILIFAGESTPPASTSVVKRLTGTTENPEARKDFEKGLLLLHNFEYPDAADMFRSAREKDPTFALAYWGEAMTCNHPIWLSQETDDARIVLARYKQKATSSTLPALDQDLMTAVEILYGEGSKAARDAAYADHMKELYSKYPDNQDIAAFYALALLGKAAGWDEALCNQAAAVAGKILTDDAKHPGALHYFIHAQDHPEFARNAWEEANRYATVASYSGHALHMPSHIYLSLGVWDRVVKSNEISWQAGVDRKKARDLSNNALNYHAHWWLAYGYLQQGRFSKAEERVQNQLTFMEELPSASARTHVLFMKGHYLVESNNWHHDLASQKVKAQDLRIDLRNLDRFINGMTAFKKGDRPALGKIVEEAEKDISAARQGMIISKDVAQCNPNSSSVAGTSQTGLNMTMMMVEELKALQAFMDNDFHTAETHFQKAIVIERQLGYSFGPPEMLKPAQEFYGDFLLQRRKFDDAVAAFEKALATTPGRTQSLIGLREALKHTGDANRIAEVNRALETNLAQAEVTSIAGFFSSQ